MPRRIEIELTSARPDGSWTWRVAGAKQPKGVLDGALLPDSTKVGDILRADAEFELEGTIITAVVAPPEKRAPDRLAILGDSRPFEGVTTSLVPKSPRRRERPDGGERREGRPPARPDGQRPAARRPGAPEGRPDRAGRPDREGRPAGDRRPDRPARPPVVRDAGTEARPDRPRPERRPDDRKSRPEDRRPRRLVAGNTHRNEVLETLPPEERAVAEQLLNGGVPALRRALQEQNTKAREEGRPEIKADALIELAEELLPRLKSAEWRDRAEAAAKEGDQLSMRDLRSVVAGGDAGARDDESRILAKTLREALDRREGAEREAWIADMTTCLDEGKVTRALRVAGRPPDPRTRFPAELSTRLTDAASEALSPETPPDRWAQLLAALLESPVRRAVKPRGLPPEPGETLLAAARQASGRVPALAPLLGLTMPPPPGPPRGLRRPPAPPPRRPPPPPPAATPVETPPAAAPAAVETTPAPSPAVDTAPIPVPAPPPAVEAAAMAPEASSMPADAEMAPEAVAAPPTASEAHAAEPVSWPYGPEAEAMDAPKPEAAHASSSVEPSEPTPAPPAEPAVSTWPAASGEPADPAEPVSGPGE